MLSCLKGYLLHSLAFAGTSPCRDPIQTYRLADTVNKIHDTQAPKEAPATHSKWNESNLKWMFCVALCIHIAMQISWMPTLAPKDRPNLSGTEQGNEKETEIEREKGEEGRAQSNSFLDLSFTIWSPLCASLWRTVCVASSFLFPSAILSSSPFSVTFFMFSLCFVI